MKGCFVWSVHSCENSSIYFAAFWAFSSSSGKLHHNYIDTYSRAYTIYLHLHLSLMQVLVKGAGDRRHQTQVITKGSGLKSLARSVGRKHRASIARQAMKDRNMKTHVVDILAKHVQKEMTVMCSKKTNSMLCSAEPEALENFSWDTLVAEVEAHLPTLLQMLRGIADLKRRVCKGRKLKLKSTRPSTQQSLAFVRQRFCGTGTST